MSDSVLGPGEIAGDKIESPDLVGGQAISKTKVQMILRIRRGENKAAGGRGRAWVSPVEKVHLSRGLGGVSE